MMFYKQNKKGDLETAKLLGTELPAWHKAVSYTHLDVYKRQEQKKAIDMTPEELKEWLSSLTVPEDDEIPFLS